MSEIVKSNGSSLILKNRNIASEEGGGRVWVRYSEAFKLHVISEIEVGTYTISSARRHYGISGCDTIQKWLLKYGKNHLLGKVVRVERPEERDQVKQLKERIRQLESALADAHIENLAYKSLIEVAEKEYKLDLKKNFGYKQSKRD
jgi:transposase-like protein